ncbi:Putative p12 protein [Acinetobacter baumannii]|nr:Putative p12 protein [Acinetobacter baumannii]
MIAFNHVVPVLNLSVFNVRRAPAFAFEQSKRATIGGRFIRVDESRDLPLLHVVEDFTQKPVCSFAVTTGGEIKIDSAAPAVDGPVQIRPAAIDLHGTVAKLAMRQPFVLFKGLTFQKLCLPGAFRPGDHHNKMLRPGLCVVHASPQYL